MASVVSAKVLAGSRPETNVSEQSTSATKPVATLGTSRVRAAPSARVTTARPAVRSMILRRRGTGVFRLGRDVAGRGLRTTREARRIWKSGWPKLAVGWLILELPSESNRLRKDLPPQRRSAPSPRLRGEGWGEGESPRGR